MAEASKLNILPPTGKNRCKTEDWIYNFSNLGNVYQMAFFGKIDIYAVKNRQIRYLWMLKSPTFSMMLFPRCG